MTIPQKQLCEYTEQRQHRIARCNNRGSNLLMFEGETAYFCGYHYAIMKRMLDRKAKYENLFHMSEEEITSALDRIHQIRTIQENQ